MITLHNGPSKLTAEERITVYTHAFALYIIRTQGCDLEVAKHIMANACAEAHEILSVPEQVN